MIPPTMPRGALPRATAMRAAARRLTTRHTALAAALLLPVAAGCSRRIGGAPAADDRPTAGGSTTRSSRRVLTVDDVRDAAPELTHAYDIVQRLRPEFLRGEGRATTISLPVIYINGQRAGGIDALRTIPRRTIDRIELLTAADAGTRFSDARGSPVLLVRTLR